MNTFYVTKYAFTQGILKVEGEISTSVLKTKGPFGTCCYHGEGREWHRTREAADVRVEEMRAKRIKSLEKQLKKLRTTIVPVVKG